jgi:hypothetical protein
MGSDTHIGGENNRTPASSLGFTEQSSRQTLREGLVEYFSNIPELMESADLPPDLAHGLDGHDVAHVVFGCDTSVRGEVVLARWSLFGVEGSLRPYLIGMRRRETRGLFRDFFRAVRLRELPALTKAGITAVIRSCWMSRRWPFDRYGPYLDRPLVEIRQEFQIRVV